MAESLEDIAAKRKEDLQMSIEKMLVDDQWLSDSIPKGYLALVAASAVEEHFAKSEFESERDLGEMLKYGIYADMRPTRNEAELKTFSSGGVPTGAFRKIKDLH